MVRNISFFSKRLLEIIFFQPRKIYFWYETSLANQSFSLDRENWSSFQPWIYSGREKTVECKIASSVYLGPQASQITKKWVTEARKLSWSFIKTNLATDTTSPVILLPDTTFYHISLPCSLVSSWSHSLHHFGLIVDFFPSCKNFHLIHQVTGRGECSDWPSPHIFKIKLLALGKTNSFSPALFKG